MLKEDYSKDGIYLPRVSLSVKYYAFDELDPEEKVQKVIQYIEQNNDLPSGFYSLSMSAGKNNKRIYEAVNKYE